MTKKWLYLIILIMISSCSKPNSVPERLATLTLKVSDWAIEVKTQNIQQLGLTTEVVFEIQDATGEYLKFDGQNKVSNVGTVQSFSLSPDQPSIKLQLKPGSYLINSRVNGKSVPKRTFKTLGIGDYELSVGTSGDSASPSPNSPGYFETSLYASAILASFDQHSLRLEGLGLAIEATDSTTYFLETSFAKDLGKPDTSDGPISSGGVSASEFWSGLKVGQALAVEGSPENGVIKARSLVILPVGSLDKTGYLNLNGKINTVNTLAKQLDLIGFEDLKPSFDNKSEYYNEYAKLETALFWSRVAVGRDLMLDGILSKQGFKINSAYLPAIGDEIPPTPDYLEGEVTELNLSPQSLRLSSNKAILVTSSSETVYYHDRLGNITAEQFWAKLSLGNYLYVEGSLDGDKLRASSMYSLNKPQSYLEGQIQNLNRESRQIKLYGWDAVDIQVNKDTSYSDNASAKSLNTEQFWQTIQKEDSIAVTGSFNSDGSVLLADEIVKTQQTVSYMAGMLIEFDQNLGKLIISNGGVVVDPLPMQIGPNPGPGTPVTENKDFTFYTTAKTSFVLDYAKNLSAEAFWQKLEPGMYLSVEGTYHNDRFETSVIYLGTYQIPDYLEGTIESFDQNQASLKLSEYPNLVISTLEANFYDENGSLISSDFWTKVKKGYYLVAEGKQSDKFYAVSVFLYQNKIPPVPVPVDLPAM